MEAAAVVEIGITRAAFWNLTPREFRALWDRHTDREIRHARQIGQICALFANANRDTKKHPEPFTIDDFAPQERGATQDRPFEGPAFLKPCTECKVPKWRGHAPTCRLGQRQFERAAGRAKHATKQALELIAAHGKGYLEPKA